LNRAAGESSAGASGSHRSFGPTAPWFALQIILVLAGCDESRRAKGPATDGKHDSPRVPPSKQVTSAAFSSGNKLLVIAYSFFGKAKGGMDPNLLDLWDVERGIKLSSPGSWEATGSGRIKDVAFIPKQDLVLSAGVDRTLKLWDARRQKLIAILDEDPEGISCVGTSRDGKFAVSGHGTSGRLKVWDLESRQLVRVFNIAHASAKQAVFSPDGKLLLIVFIPTTGEPCAIELRSMSHGKLVRSFPISEEWSSPVAFSPDSKLALLRKRDALVMVNVATGEEARRFGKQPTSVSFSSDQKLVIAFCEPTSSPTLSSWETRTAHLLRSRKMIWWQPFIFSADARLAFSAEGYDSPAIGRGSASYMTLRVWDIATGDEFRSLAEALAALKRPSGTK
jgi:WD40 repeat protein